MHGRFGRRWNEREEQAEGVNPAVIAVRTRGAGGCRGRL